MTRLGFWGLLFVLLPGLAMAQTERKAWSDVAPPTLTWVGTKADPSRVSVEFLLVTGTDGADKAVVDLLAGDKVVESRTMGKSKNDTKVLDFAPAQSGSYRVRVSAFRTGMPDPKVVEGASFLFTLPLAPPQISARNMGDGAVLVTWSAVPEADSYELSWPEAGASAQSVKGLSATLPLVPGQRVPITVSARRGSEASASAPLEKLVTKDPERIWTFTWFGQSSNASVNRFQMLDPNAPRFQLFSATTTPSGQIDLKGGKFTTFHDGISFYYTAIDPKTENFVLTATFTVDFINPVPDGQEGFGLLALDSLGAPGVNMVNHYTNSAGLIATKFEATVDGVKKTSKDTLGARFVTGITPEVLALGDSGIAQNGVNVSTAFSYETADLVQKGGVYTLTLKKTNTGYHVAFAKPGAAPTEYTLFDANKLAQLDPAHDYVGFAAARGCNVTVSDVRMTVTDPKNDPPGQEEPPLLVPLTARVDSPTATGTPTYPFVFTANAQGRLTVSREGTVLVDRAEVPAGQDLERVFALKVGQNDFSVRFEVDPAYRPGPRSRMGLPGPGSSLVAVEGPVEFKHTVYHRTYPGSQLHVAPSGSSLGDGTPQKPLSLATALSFVRPGQTIVLAEGTYRPRSGLAVERGHNGTKAQPIRLVAAPGTRPVLDFEFSTGGMVVWGDWWILDGFDITQTPGNVKGLQIAGSHNVVQNIQTSFCGDTGLQISGQGSDPFEKWPAHNLVANCTSWGNNDPAQNNADGFAAKLTCGPGNVFRQCIAFHNIDDGWDLFSKIESGPIGAVTIDSCVAYGNGRLPDGSGNGDGNGFKLGGDGIVVPHLLRNSIAFDNGASGITSNSDPAVILENNTSFANRGPNINLYGKGAGQRLFQARNNLSLRGGSADVYREMPELASPNNYFWNGAQALNSEGRTLGLEVFVQTDISTVPGRRTDGSIDLQGFLVLSNKAPLGLGSGLK